MTKPQNHPTQEISRIDFVRSEVTKLGYKSSGLGMTGPLADVDYLLGLALEEELDPETLDALVWAIKSHKIDWQYQFWCAKHYGHDRRLDQVLAKAGLTHLRAQQPPQDNSMGRSRSCVGQDVDAHSGVVRDRAECVLAMKCRAMP